MTGFASTVKRFFQTRDELYLGNMRRSLWPLLLVFPMTVILGDFRYFNLYFSVSGLESYEWMLYPLGAGWLVLVFIPKHFITSLLKIAAVCCALLLPVQFLLVDEVPRLAAFMGFQFFNGICAACAFFLFCFKLNNVERLSGMALILFYYSLYYTIYRAFPAVQAFYKTWLGAAVMVFYLVMVFMLRSSRSEASRTNSKVVLDRNYSEASSTAALDRTYSEASSTAGSGSIIKVIIGLHIVYYLIMCMINYIETAENIIFSLPYGLGQYLSIIMIIFIMLISNRSALYIWLMFLVFSLLGLTIVSYNSEAARFSGSLIYGLGDGLGYIIIYYLCSGAIKKSASIKMYKLFCLILFIEYFFISGILSRVFILSEGSNHAVALGIVVVFSSFCFLILPYLQKKLFEVDWSDGLYLKDMAEYSQGLAETDSINDEEQLDLTEREHEVFTMLLKGMAPKEIAFTLKVSYPTINFHRNNLYRKLGIQSRAELFAKYSKTGQNSSSGQINKA